MPDTVDDEAAGRFPAPDADLETLADEPDAAQLAHEDATKPNRRRRIAALRDAIASPA